MQFCKTHELTSEIGPSAKRNIEVKTCQKPIPSEQVKSEKKLYGNVAQSRKGRLTTLKLIKKTYEEELFKRTILKTTSGWEQPLNIETCLWEC